MANLTPPPNWYPRTTHPPATVVGVPAVVVPAPPYSLLLAINACGMTRANQDLTFVTEVYIDDFESYNDMSNADLADSFKTFSGLTATQGQIRLMPEQNNNIKSFTQWVKDKFRLGIDPTTLPFPQADTAELIRRLRLVNCSCINQTPSPRLQIQ